MSQRHVFLGMPSYGHQTAAAGRAFWLACEEGTHVIKEQSIGSLLANNMNKLWARALTVQQRGREIDYFAMLHDDIGLEDGWLDKLIDEMEANDLDMLGVVAPIKDARGLTSLALAHPDGDPWHVLCRLSMREVYQLPATFTSEHTTHPLLLNTGCWVCRFNQPWRKRVHFTINDCITYNEEDNQFEAQVESEDWFFSRLCHEQGVRIGATRKIALHHEGPTRYVNTIPWGQNAFDSPAVTESPIPPRTDGFNFPFEVQGWLSLREGESLSELARGKRVLEIGSYCGRSTICLAQTAEHVDSIDPHDGRATPHPQDTFEMMRDNLSRYGVKDRVSMFRGTSEQINEDYGPYDLVFIDGNHEEEWVQQDIGQSLRVLKPDGLLAFHDYRRKPAEFDGRWDPGVTQAVNELLASGGELISTHETVAVVRPPAAIPLEV